MNQTVAGQRPGVRARLMERAGRSMLQLPDPKHRYRVSRNVAVPTRDGHQLLTDHYWPETEKPAGTILVRGPYGRGMPGSLLYGATFASAGYHVLDQSVRGIYGSTGNFEPFVNEAFDAQDTVAWLRDQPWFDGRLATLGGSYLGFTQWALHADPPPELRASVIVVGPHDLGKAIHGSGAFSLSAFFGWSEGISGQDKLSGPRRLMSMVTQERRAAPALNGLPLADAGEAVLGGRAPWYRQWLEHTDPADPYWRGASHQKALTTSTVPTLLVGGWDDVFLELTLEQWAAMSRRRRGRGVDVALTIGPWTHLDTVRKATGLITRESLDWLDEHLSDVATGSRGAPVRIFVKGIDVWRDLPDWPPSVSSLTLNLATGGRLTESPGTGTETVSYDPADPTPAVGGRLLSPRGAGAVDNRKLEGRSDVLTFTGDALTSPLEVIGQPHVQLAISVDNPHSDIFVRLCSVDPRGASHNFADGFVRLDPTAAAGKVQHLDITLDACAQVLGSGHRLRLQVSGGAHPRYARNLGSGEPLSTGKTLVGSTRTLHLAKSSVILPVGTT